MHVKITYSKLGFTLVIPPKRGNKKWEKKKMKTEREKNRVNKVFHFLRFCETNEHSIHYIFSLLHFLLRIPFPFHRFIILSNTGPVGGGRRGRERKGGRSKVRVESESESEGKGKGESE